MKEGTRVIKIQENTWRLLKELKIEYYQKYQKDASFDYLINFYLTQERR